MNQLNNKKIKNLPGAAMLISVLVITVIGVSIILTILIIVNNGSYASQVAMQHYRAQAAAQACAEATLYNLNQDINYPAGDTLTFSNSNCEVITISGSGNTNRVMDIEGYSGDVTARMQINIQTLQPQIVITSWQDVADF